MSFRWVFPSAVLGAFIAHPLLFFLFFLHGYHHGGGVMTNGGLGRGVAGGNIAMGDLVFYYMISFGCFPLMVSGIGAALAATLAVVLPLLVVWLEEHILGLWAMEGKWMARFREATAFAVAVGLVVLAVAGLGEGLVRMAEPSVTISPFGFPVELTGLWTVVLGAPWWVPAILLGVIIVSAARAASAADRIPWGWSSAARFLEVRRLAAEGRQVDAIHELRVLTGASLEEAKAAVEKYLGSRRKGRAELGAADVTTNVKPRLGDDGARSGS
jgi:ribosomal protein L7/L12